MTLTLSNDFWDYQYKTTTGGWDFSSGFGREMKLKNMQASICWTDTQEGRIHSKVVSPGRITSAGEQEILSPSGPATGIMVEAGFSEGMRLVQEFCPGPNKSLLWRTSVTNLHSAPKFIDHINMMESRSLRHSEKYGGVSYVNPQSGLTVEGFESSLRCFVNGWQSWSVSGSFGKDQRMPRSRFKPFLDPMHNPTARKYPTSRGHFVSDLFGVVGSPGEIAFLIGFLTQKQAFGQLEIALNKDPAGIRLWQDTDRVLLLEGQTFSTDWAILQPIDSGEVDSLEPYLSLFAQVNGARNDGFVPVGWCSWYHYFQDITEEALLNNVTWISNQNDKFRFNLIQLDDGFQAEVGDWYRFSTGFPEGVTGAASEIRDFGFRPGLWLAPFILHPGSFLYKNKPEWIIKNRNGKPSNAGFVWNRFTSGLDVSHPEVQEYTGKLINTAANEWGFSYLKLDFLYAGVLKGRRYNQSMTRAQSLNQIFHLIRDSAGPEVSLLGCGCPLGSGVGIFDIMRIGADVAPEWAPSFFGVSFPFRKECVFPSARNSIRSILARMPMHRRLWVNDPDCILLRKTETKLSEAEVQSLVTAVSFSAGAQIVSDNLPELDKERMDWLSFMLPPIEEQAVVIDWFTKTEPELFYRKVQNNWDQWYLAARINWLDQATLQHFSPADFLLEDQKSWFLFDLWQNSVVYLGPGEEYIRNTEPHGTGLIVFRRRSGEPQWIGDTLHISQGGLIKGWDYRSGHLGISLSTDRPRKGDCWLYIPGSVSGVSFDSNRLKFMQVDNGILKVSLELISNHNLEVEFQNK